MTRLDALIVTLASRPVATLLTLGGAAVGFALLDVLLRERCGTCGERVKVPIAAHWLVDHAGEEEL